MERLTKRDNDGQAMMDCEKCKADWTGKHGKPMFDCTALYCRNRLKERLAAYEDTGLTPEEINDLASVREISPEAEYAINKHADNIIERLDKLLRQTDDDARLRELAEADRAGRLVVLPCKVGDTVWITGSVRRLYSEKVRTFFCGDPSYSRGMADNGVKMIRTTGCDIPIHEFGKTVFLTREEAEKALEAKSND